MSPLTLTLLLLTAQALLLATSLRKSLWRVVPSWLLYVSLATIHVISGIVAQGLGYDYPMILLYFEPAFILGQIAFTFESSIKILGFKLAGGSAPESRLLVWLVPLVPAAIVLPIEIGFIQDALATWHSQEDESLRLVYSIRMFLSITLFVVLALIPAIGWTGKKAVKPAVRYHHHVVTAYMACNVLGYVCKYYVSRNSDLYLTVTFFIFGPVLCFLFWSWRMRTCGPADFEPVEDSSREDVANVFERRVFADCS